MLIFLISPEILSQIPPQCVTPREVYLRSQNWVKYTAGKPGSVYLMSIMNFETCFKFLL